MDDKVNEFITLWFSQPHLWFKSNFQDDIKLKEKYEDLVILEIGETSYLNLIIIYDQLARHLFRNNELIIQYYLEKALEITRVFDYNDPSLSMIEWCFAKLPIRHSKNTELIFELMSECWKKLETVSERDKKILKKFIIATYERAPPLNPIQSTNLSRSIESDYSDIIDLSQKIYDENALIPKISFSSSNNILSLSGGVDSMVCALLLEGYYKVAVHINYTNRESSIKEEEMLSNWCKDKGIILYIRRISEINREPCMNHDMRELYENYTRKVRYDSYKFVANELKLGDINVILGHNKDDCMENILTNISHMNHYDNLQGMLTRSVQDGITFIRPLLKYTKYQIRATATNYNIPHFKNSTPSWSQRGKIRDIVRPSINEWDPHFETGCMELSSRLSSLYLIMNNILEKHKKFYSDNGYLKFEDIEIENLYLKELVYKCTGQRISDKSVKNLVLRLLNLNENKERVILSKQLSMLINDKKIYFE